MKLKISSRLPVKCFYTDCVSSPESLKTRPWVRKGYFLRKSDGKVIPRFYCKSCKRSFSAASNSPCFRQKKRRLNHKIEALLVSSVSQRRIALILGISPHTVVRKFRFLAQQARLEQKQYLKSLESTPLTEVFFDEMESVERSKCLPVSIPLTVDPKTRKILNFRVCSMPAKGHLAAISRKKYGYREDQRPQAAQAVFTELKPCLVEAPTFSTDQKTDYPFWIRPHFPKATHRAYKGRRGCVVGQGELKRGGFDPLFAFNHVAAMLRANINRLVRRTWCVSQLKERLEDHIMIYACFHNRVLT